MRLAVWNMGKRRRAWDWLERRDDIDVALLQEATRPPASLSGTWRSMVWRAAPAARCGCLVLARSVELDEVDPGPAYPWLVERAGVTAIARTVSDPRWLVSFHAPARPIPKDVAARIPFDGVEVTTRDGSLWDTYVIPHELRRLFGDDSFLWGGDLNCEPRMDEVPSFLGGNRRMFERYHEDGSHDLRRRFHVDHQQTFFPNRQLRRPWQLDHVFADEATAQRVTSWRVEAGVARDEPRYSDHAPIVIDLDEGSQLASFTTAGNDEGNAGGSGGRSQPPTEGVERSDDRRQPRGE